MAKYIELEDAYRYLSRYYHHSTYVQSMALREALDRVPAADVVERTTGKRIVDWDRILCPACQAIGTIEKRKYKYCPYCGTEMIEDDDV